MPCVSCLHKYTVNGVFKHFSFGGKKKAVLVWMKQKKSMPSKINIFHVTVA